MPPDLAAPLRLFAPALAAMLALGCAVPEPAPPPIIVVAPTAEPPAPPPPPPPAPPPVFRVFGTNAATALLAFADQVRGMPQQEAAAELARLNGQLPTPTAQMRMALLLLQVRGPGDSARAAQLLQRVQAQEGDEARELHPLARLIAAHLADQRRLEEQLERQSHQLRESQRRAEQLQDRLEALRAIERARPTRPTP